MVPYPDQKLNNTLLGNTAFCSHYLRPYDARCCCKYLQLLNHSKRYTKIIESLWEDFLHLAWDPAVQSNRREDRPTTLW